MDSTNEEQRSRITELFTRAQHLPHDEQSEFLAKACQGDAELRTEVESLLVYARHTPSGFMKVRELGSQDDSLDDTDPLINATIGSYSIKSLIASGGMGRVYLAEQANPRRHVALKLMNTGLDSRAALRRFQYEAQILAHLRHPNIAQVFEAGTHSTGQLDSAGIPFFVMEYITDGKPITQYAEAEGLKTRQRVELFIDACEAVHHGHQKAIIHRDLKPANVLVDSSGQVKIIDFGVARATDSDIAITTMRTDARGLVGTIPYMSPEQCQAESAEIDTRSDVYSLGIVLFELLIGQLPFDFSRTPLPQALRTVLEESLPRPSALCRSIRGDLETILLKALEKDKEERYQSTLELAQDLDRFLKNEPIAATPPTTLNRLLHWMTRHPVLTTTFVCSSIAAVAVAATLIAIWISSLRPHTVLLSDDGQDAWLVSALGKILHTWSSKAPNGIKTVEFVQGPETSFVLLGYSLYGDNEHAGYLCAYDVNGDRDVPIWKAGVEHKDILPELRYERPDLYRIGDFVPKKCAAIDIFPGVPGDELLTVFAHKEYYPHMICVSDQQGRDLFKAWHRGSISSSYWMYEARLLILTGTNNEASWSKRGYASLKKHYPWVVLAVRPKRGLPGAGLISTNRGDSPFSSIWYKTILPAGIADRVLDCTLYAPENNSDTGSSVHMVLTMRLGTSSSRPGVYWDVDENGNRLPQTLGWNDDFDRHKGILGRPDAINLVPLQEVWKSPDPDE